jgi:hypothetical protein
MDEETKAQELSNLLHSTSIEVEAKFDTPSLILTKSFDHGIQDSLLKFEQNETERKASVLLKLQETLLSLAISVRMGQLFLKHTEKGLNDL